MQNYAKKNFFDKCLLFGWLNWICFLFSNLIWQDAISPYLLLKVNQGNWLLFEKLKGNFSLKRKKQPLRVIHENSCMLKEAATRRSSRSQMLFKIGALKNFAIFAGKHPCWSLFKMKLQAWKLATLLKRESNPVFFFVNIVKSLRTAFFIEHLRWLLLQKRWERDVLIFINIEIVGKLKYTNGLQLVTSLKSELLHRYLLFPFFAILNIFT